MAKDSLRFLGLDPSSSVDCTCNILNKELSVFNYVQYMLDRTNRMFRYTGLPDTIPEYMLEYMLQTYGSVAILSHNDSLYAFRCHFGGPPDPYYRPTQAVIANPALNITATYQITNNLPPFDKFVWEEMPHCIRFLNDSQINGLIPLFARYATQMAENDVSIRSAQINLRQQTVIAADTGPEIESAEAYIKSLEEGKLSSIQKRPFTDGVKVMNAASGQSNVVIQLIELQQYLKASWYNEIGLNSNFNMKRQYMSSDEVNSSADIMLPLIDNMLYCREQAIDAINKEFGTSITVEKDSAWEKKQLQSDMSVSINPETGDPINPETGEPLFVPSSVDETDDTDSPSSVDETDDTDSPSSVDETDDTDSEDNTVPPEIMEQIVETVAEILDEKEEDDTDADT